MSHSHHRHKRNKVRSLHLWHRYTGLSVAVLVVILAISGILLNHTESFQWDRRYISNGWLLDWYGIKAPEQVQHYPLGKQSLTLFGNQLYFDDQPLPGEFQKMQGALASDDLLAAAVDSSLLLITHKGELIEQLDSRHGLPIPIAAMGITPQGIAVVQVNGKVLETDADWLRWTPFNGDPAAISWARSDTLPAGLEATLTRQFRSHIIPMERVLLDLHSGRIFGAYGVWLMDLAALLMILLAASGAWMWYRRRR